MADKKFTAEQLSMLTVLKVCPEQRQAHYQVYKGLQRDNIVSTDYRRYLRDRIHAMIARERRASSTVYLGD